MSDLLAQLKRRIMTLVSGLGKEREEEMEALLQEYEKELNRIARTTL